MKIYHLAAINTGFETLVLENTEADFPAYFEPNFNGTMIKEWGKIKVKTNRKGKRTDAPSFLTGMPIISKRAVDVFANNLKDNIQILPLIHDQHDYSIVNVVNVIDALDHNNAVIKRFSDGTIQDIVTYSFHADLLQNQLIFKIPEYPETKVFVTDTFKNIIESNKLVGFRFDEVWSSEKAPSENDGELHSGPDLPSTETYPYREAAQFLLAGKAIASGVWKLQQESKGNIVLGEWVEGEYRWIDPIAYPPILHELKWVVVERSAL